jgi:hypothetical protein
LTPQQVLALAQDAMRAGRFIFTFHAEVERGPQRGAKYHDIKSAILSAKAAEKQPNGSWRLTGGTDLDGDDLTVAIVVDAQSIRIVSLFV